MIKIFRGRCFERMHLATLRIDTGHHGWENSRAFEMTSFVFMSATITPKSGLALRSFYSISRGLLRVLTRPAALPKGGSIRCAVTGATLSPALAELELQSVDSL